MVLNVHRNHKAYYGRGGGGGVGSGGGGIIYLSLHCHHQNDSCIKIGNDESHESTNFEEKGEPKQIRTEVYQPNVLPLGQTGYIHYMSEWPGLLYIYITVFVMLWLVA